MVAAFIAWFGVRNQKEPASDGITPSNPLQFRLALQMAVQFQIVLFAVRWGAKYIGRTGRIHLRRRSRVNRCRRPSRLNGKGHRRSIARCNGCYGHRRRGSLQYTIETRNRNDHRSEAVSQSCCHWVVCRCRCVRTVTSLAALRSLHQGPRTRAGYRPANARVRNVVLPAET